MTWSTPAVFSETLRRAESCGLRVVSLPSWFDIDTAADLDRLRQDLNRLGDATPSYTQHFFASHALPTHHPRPSA